MNKFTMSKLLPAVCVLTMVGVVLLTTGCAGRTEPPFGPDRVIPPDQSRLTFTPEASGPERELVMEAARALSCQHPLGCTCFLDGFQTSCAFVFACLDVGLCECVSGCENVGD